MKRSTTVLSLIFAVVCSILEPQAMPSPAESATGVYCANGKIEVDNRSLQQMLSARGSNVCQFGSFSYVSDAENFVKKNFGGVGASCACR